MNIKKRLWFSILLIGAVLMATVVFVLHPGFFLRSKKIGNAIVFPGNNVAVQVELARTPYAWSKGLMFREALPEGGGMLFVFPSETKRSFWMKNTLIPLDMLFIGKDKEIVTIVRGAEPCKDLVCPSYASTADAMYVLEVNAGFVDMYGIQEGDVVEF
ncbi:MAG: Protein of hypothetical function DUF192 [Candidatus Wolfebacteria bacterium GW2011_GWE1_48_7]|uniref:DUF192 domain-containing protein n=2 Tax=Candidatus Wolfeibacteriota TaxID=1752735 RepID=A0A0G4AT15_9BACT|nr:MAG: hypothetical protein UX70_C0001G0156 [Candidatus Wolfebacteria bacterium GW2011_GWB1_47_1]KKU36738.1 MAG: Protein of hypothetical function DUF192 [Candidatus Wolfebacteria bacterium GW2011_GWC2_46_275]KKU99900.1 MAG: Protein of hypothetical function DUF192 [Candidatus Wolfebacteria bacterium GW2011_GWE1_48_7]